MAARRRRSSLGVRLAFRRRGRIALNEAGQVGTGRAADDGGEVLQVDEAVGLAPGRTGANRTGRPFTGDFAGVLLYETLIKTGFAIGRYEARPDDGLKLVDCMISNAVRCAPPGNKPETSEEANCRPFLAAQIAALPRLKVIVTLGDVARRNLMRALGLKASAGVGGHGARAEAAGLVVINSYHCSRLNTNTGRLTPAMFEAVFDAAKAELAAG